MPSDDKPESQSSDREDSPRQNFGKRTLADRDRFYAEQRRLRQEQNGKSKPVGRRRKTYASIDGARADPRLLYLRASDDFTTKMDWLMRELVTRGWAEQDAATFARDAIKRRSQFADASFCRCEAKATVASKSNGALCIPCFLDMDCGIFVSEDPRPSGLTDRRRTGVNLSEPSPWQENAIRDREDG